MVMEQALVRRRAQRPPWMLLCLASPLVLLLGWTALWMFVQREAASAMDRWIASEAGHGRHWSCPDREIAGFPLQMRVSCSQPRFQGRLGGEPMRIETAGLVASTYLYRPSAVGVSLQGPMILSKEGQDRPAVLSWSALRIEARILEEAHLRFAVVAETPALENGGVTDRADHAELRVSPAPGKPLGDNAYEAWVKIDGGTLPALDAVMGGSEPLSVDEKGIVTHVDVSRGEPWQALVEQWRQSGGTVSISALSLVKGGLQAQAQGEFTLDEGHRPLGRLQAILTGYEPLAARLGIPVRAAAMGGLLTRLLNRGAAASKDPSSVSLPVILSQGRVSVGPFTTSLLLAPLY